jgi:glutamate/tyrosine decarboxylase-like PLP-dependent enzyme
MANFTCLAAGRDAVLRRAGWDIATQGLVGSPGVRVLVGEERHDTVDLALRYLGLGAPEPVAADEQGRLLVADLERALAQHDGPTVVSLQAGNVHSGGYDPFAEAIDLAHRHGAWVHVDGAFGLWAAASPNLKHLTRGLERADSWATDAHKWLNVPYDCGIAIVADAAKQRGAMASTADYIPANETDVPWGVESIPEFSRRARGIPLYAALRTLGRDGVADLVDRCCEHAQRIAARLAAAGGDVEILNDVVLNQVLVAAPPSAVARIQADGTCWVGGTTWHGMAAMRISVSNWSTTEEDADLSVAAIRRCAEAVAGRA